MIDLTEIIVAIIGLISAILTGVLIPYIKKKTNAEKYSTFMMWAKIGVQAAEMIYKEAGSGKEKKNYVLGFLREKGFDVDEETISALIESAVLDLKKAAE